MLEVGEVQLRAGDAGKAGRDPQVRAVVAFALPRRDELAVGLRGERGITLETGGEGVDRNLHAGAPARQLEVLRVHARVAPILSRAVPDHGELARVEAAETGDDPGPPLIARGEGVHVELRPEPVPGSVEPLAVDSHVGTVLLVALPDDDRLPGRIERHVGPVLEVRLGRVDPEFSAEGCSGIVVAPRHDRRRLGVLMLTGPYHDEVAGRVHRDARAVLMARRVLVDLELRGERVAARVVSPGEDPRAAAVLGRLAGQEVGGAGPDDDEVAGRIQRDGRPRLGSRRVRIDDDVSALRCPRGVEPPRAKLVGRIVGDELGPRDDEVPGGVGADEDAILVPGRRHVDRELPSERRPRRVEEAADRPGLGAVLPVRTPDDDETGGRADVGDGGGVLIARRRRVDLEFSAQHVGLAVRYSGDREARQRRPNALPSHRSSRIEAVWWSWPDHFTNRGGGDGRSGGRGTAGGGSLADEKDPQKRAPEDS